MSSLCFCEVRVISHVVCTMTMYFQGKIREFGREWLKKNNLSIFMSVLQGML